MASLLNFLRTGPPPPKAVLLPGALFFTRSIPVTPGATPAEITSQVELALEAIAPFPLAQLYYGWFAVPGAERAFVFAAYRRRFTAEQVAAWEGAELVMPAFAAVFGAQVEPSTTIFITEPEGLTAVHWEDSAMPSKVLVRPLVPEAGDEERARVRGELLTAIGGSKTVIDLPAPPIADAAKSDREIVFRSGDFVSALPVALTAAFDVRDKGELAAIRNAQRRDVIFWRVAVGCVAALLLLGLGEVGLMGGRAWQGVRMAKVHGQKGPVEKIVASQALAFRIEDLATKQLLPIEMLTELVGVNSERRPPDITFSRATTDKARGLYTIVIEARTTNAPQMTVYEAAMRKLPSIEPGRLEVLPQPSRNQDAVFQITATFKPGALKPTKP